MSLPTPLPTSSASPDPLAIDVSLPRIELDSMEDFDHIAAQVRRVSEEFDEGEKRSILAEFEALLKTINPSKSFIPDEVYGTIKRLGSNEWAKQTLDIVKSNVTIGGMPFDQCSMVEPVSLDLHERLLKIQADRDELLRQVVTMRSTHPANYETMIQDSIRLRRKMNIERAAQVKVSLPEPSGPSLQNVTAQGVKDLDEAVESCPDAWKPIDESS